MSLAAPWNWTVLLVAAALVVDVAARRRVAHRHGRKTSACRPTGCSRSTP